MTQEKVNQNAARVLTPAESADESARMERARVIGGVRTKACPQCHARSYGPCQVSPPGDCLARWLAAYTAKRISRADLIEAIRSLIVITVAQLVEEAAA